VKEGRHGGLKSSDNIVGKPSFLVRVASLVGLATIDILMPDIVRIK